MQVLPTLPRRAASEAAPPAQPGSSLLTVRVYTASIHALEQLPLEKLPLESLPGAHLGPGPQVAALAAAALLPVLLLCACWPRSPRAKTKQT